MYLVFEKVGQSGKTETYNVVSKTQGFVLGRIKWYWAWRQYCFFPETFADVVFSEGCLHEITDFMNELKRQHEKKKVIAEGQK